MPLTSITLLSKSRRQERRRRAGSSKGAVLLILFGALMFGGGVYGYRVLTTRSAEAAIERLIPADAGYVVTLDLKPTSPEQIRAMDRIREALRREGLDSQITDSLDKVVCEDPVARDVFPHLGDGWAAAAWERSGSPQEGVVLAMTRDREEVRRALERHARHTKEQEGVTLYEMPTRGKSYAALIGDYLVVADSEVTLLRIHDVYAGRKAALASVAGYQEARKALPADANLMAFASAEAVRSAGRQVSSWPTGGVLSVADPLRAAGWQAASVTVRETGLAMDWYGPWDAEGQPGLKRLGQIAALEPSALDRLPAGAIGVFAVSEPAAYGEAIREAAGVEPEARDGIEQGIRDFERETGISVSDEVLPAFRGNVLFAAYPVRSGKGVEAVAVVDDVRNADPARLADALRRYVSRFDNGPRFSSEERGGATLWTVGGADAHNRDNGWMSQSGDHEGVERAAQTGEFVYAQVGKTLLAASSREMLERAVEAYQAGGGTARGLLSRGTKDREPLQRHLLPGAQSAFLLSPGALRDALRPMLNSGWKSPEGAPDTDDLFAVFGADLNEGVVASERYDGKAFAGHLFFPIDYDRAAEVAGRVAKKAQEQQER